MGPRLLSGTQPNSLYLLEFDQQRVEIVCTIPLYKGQLCSLAKSPGCPTKFPPHSAQQPTLLCCTLRTTGPNIRFVSSPHPTTHAFSLPGISKTCHSTRQNRPMPTNSPPCTRFVNLIFTFSGRQDTHVWPQTPRDIVVPQRPYVANIQRNHVFTIRPLVFMTNHGTGIRLSDILEHKNTGLLHADSQPLEGFGTKVTYRIEVHLSFSTLSSNFLTQYGAQWPGYESFNKQKHALRATRQKQSVSLQKVALHVAEVMKDFIQVRVP